MEMTARQSAPVSGPAEPLRDSARTREAILVAAQQAFSTRGYSAAGVREVTAAAGVNPALVSRYFGSKEGLFEAALDASLSFEMLTARNRATFGRDLVEAFTADNTRTNPLPMLVLATGDPDARQIADRVLRARVIRPLTRWFGGPQAEVRAARLLLVSAGFFTYRLLYPLAPLEGTLDPAMRAWLEAEFQSLVD